MTTANESKSETTIDRKGPSSGTNWLSHSTNISNHPTVLLHSPATGLRGLVLSTSEPLCSLHIIISTCATTSSTSPFAHGDDGLPHTLEHAIFLGSDMYPYKGILDKLANRSLADGTNAWTATDHTAYTLTTAGEEGVLNLLPIYADHVLYPTMTEESFLTEVHHVTPEGSDKGVVYCEMQGRENTDGSLVDRALMDLLYPHGCGYSSETGGKLSNLRTLTNEKVRWYHGENYTPDNVIFVLTGNVDEIGFFNALDKVEERVKAKINIKQSSSLDRPWINHKVPPMDLTMNGVMPPPTTIPASTPTDTNKHLPKEIKFPSEDETRGTISIGWRAPTYSQRQTRARLYLLWKYLTSSAASPLQKIFVECDDPVCAGVSPAHEVFTEGYHQLWFTEVDVGRMDEIVPKLFHTLHGISNGDVPFDMERIKMVIRRERRRIMEYNERRPTYAVIDSVVRNFLYAPRHSPNSNDLTQEVDDLKADVDELPYLLDALEHTTQATWIQILQEYMLSRPYAVVIGRPSAQLATDMAEDEKKREQQQAEDLGEQKLIQLGETLDAAIAYNEREIPDGVLTSVPIPSLENVKAVPVLTLRGVADSIGFAAKDGDAKGCSVEAESELVLSRLRQSATNTVGADAYYVDWNHIESAFLYTAVSLTTKQLTPTQRLYLPLLLELAFKLPAKLDDGSTLTKDQFVSQLQDDTVSNSASSGLPGASMPQMITFAVQIENPNGDGFAPAMEWLRRVLYQTVLSTEAVKIAASRLLSEIPPQIRSGSTICNAVSMELNFDGRSSDRVAESPLKQWPFLAGIVKRMDDSNDGNEGSTKVLDELIAVRKELVQQQNFQIFVAGNLMEIPDPMETLVRALAPPITPSVTGKGRLINDVSSLSVRSTATGRAAICSLSAIESSFLGLSCPGVEAYDPNHAPLLVAIEYLTALEGDFWVKLRGAGLTYGSSIRNSTESKLLKFGLFKCTDVTGAFQAATRILTDYASGNATIPPVGLSSAKSSLAYGIISGVSTKLGAARNAFVGNYESTQKKVDYDRWLLGMIEEVTIDDVMHALVTYLIPLFDSSSNLAVACPFNKMEEIGEFFQLRGWANVELVPEDKLCEVFSNDVDTKDTKEGNYNASITDDNGKNNKVLKNVPGLSMFLPGAFAAQFKCDCPRCDTVNPDNSEQSKI